MDKPIMKSKKPIKVEVVEGKHYAWCTCGRTKREVFCDGSHKKLDGIEPVIFKAKKTGEVKLCQCKLTKTPPYCDMTHKNIKED